MSQRPQTLDRPTVPPPPRPPVVTARRGAGRRITIAISALIAVMGGIAGLALAGAPDTAIPTVSGRAPTAPLALARYDAQSWLTRFMASDGRVIRRDQGGDTVSEGQGYAMLLSVAIGSQKEFDLAWQWDQHNLQLPNKLSSYHWQNGTVTGQEPASDADLDMAWALVLAAKRFHAPADRTDGLQIASAILANETVNAGGKLELVAGPWARSAPFPVDASYFAPAAMQALQTASGDARWGQLLTDSQQLVISLDKGSDSLQLPPDWASLQTTGQVTPAGAPSTKQAPAYGLDAQRVPVWFAADCSAKGRAIAAATWPVLQSAAGGGARLSYSLTGKSESNLTNPLGAVGAAAAADASGARSTAAALLRRADKLADRYHTYYGDAWVALGRVLLDTKELSPCPPSQAS